MHNNPTLERAFVDERPRLQRWMTSLTGDPIIGDDLVQEIYTEAWVNRHKLVDNAGVVHWLNAIARNVYKRWLRSRGKQSANEQALDHVVEEPIAEYELERNELIELLDKALAQLPAETRTILIARYLEDQPQAKVAQDLGMTESAVAVRLHRGKMAIRKLLDAEITGQQDAWQETRLWCGLCGKHHYEARFDSETGELSLRCPHCTAGEEFPSWDSKHEQHLIKGIKTLKPAFNRLRVSLFQEYNEYIEQGYAICKHCGSKADIKLTMPDFIPVGEDYPGIHLDCPNCGVVSYTALNGVVGSSPAGLEFEKANSRAVILPVRYLNHQGHEAVQISVQSVNSADSLDVIFARDSYKILSIYRNGKEINHED